MSVVPEESAACSRSNRIRPAERQDEAIDWVVLLEPQSLNPANADRSRRPGVSARVSLSVALSNNLAPVPPPSNRAPP